VAGFCERDGDGEDGAGVNVIKLFYLVKADLDLDFND
jgi:hypothetical protein